MGLKITSETNTDKGISKEVYLMIDEVYFSKRGNAQIPVKTYKSKEDRDKNVEDVCNTFDIKKRYDFKIDTMTLTIDDFYTKIKQELEKNELVVENLK